jgi:hypothetical protein
MITYYKIEKLMGLSSEALMRALAKNGHTDTIKETKFLGITNGRQFCYEILYFDPKFGEDAYTKVFVDLDTDEQPIADF